MDEFWLVCVLALIGLATRVFRQAPRWLWAIPLLLALSVVLVNVETPRFREPVDPFLLLLASCAVATGLQKLGLGGAPVWRGRQSPLLARDRQLVKMIQRLS